MGLFKKEEIREKPTPTEEVLKLRQQGMSDSDIIQDLQKKGFESTHIFDSLSQADLRTNAGPPQMQKEPEPPQFQQEQYTPPMPQEEKEQETMGADKIEEIAESIIDEKWDELVKDVNKIIEWKNEMNTKISNLEEKSTHLQENFDKLHKAIIGKIDEYDLNLKNISAELKAINEVFSKVLPTFTENVQTLNRITSKLSKKSTIKIKKK